MRELITSSATLASLLGVAYVYHNGNPFTSSYSLRTRREAEITAIDDNLDYEDTFSFEKLVNQEDEFQADLKFIKSLGLLEEDSDISDMPEVFKEDIEMFQNSDSISGPKKSRKSVQFVMKCMKNNNCLSRAQATFKNWGKNYRVFMENHMEDYMRPVFTKALVDPENNSKFKFCTPKDDLITCSDSEENPRFGYSNSNPKTELTQEPELLKHLLDLKENSITLSENFEATNVQAVDAENNVFTSENELGLTKFVLVIPNGVPISMPTDFKQNYANYWKFFKTINEKYIGFKKGSEYYPGRKNFAVWFIRQDEEPKAMMKKPALGRKFPWKRFEQMMNSPQPTAIQPKLKETFKMLNQQASGGTRVGATKNRGNDCFIFWFHQYLPQDLTDLADPFVQENHIYVLEERCTVIHFWVGFNNIDTDKNSLQVVKYLQGILQPHQKLKTSYDPEYRGWYYIDSLEKLGEEKYMGDLTDKVYNLMAAEKLRTTCMYAHKTLSFATETKKALDYTEADLAKQDDYYYNYGTTTENTLTTNGTTEATTEAASDPNYDDVYTFNTTLWSTVDYPDVVVPAEWACCGIGFSGKKFDTNVQKCCEDGLHGIDDRCYY